MPKHIWNSRYETGFKEIDDQHKRLLEKIDRFQVALYAGSSTAELTGMIEYLSAYIEEHLETEEAVLQECNFPDLKNHRQHHDMFRDKCSMLIKRFKASGADSYLAIEVEKLVVSWWEEHVMKMDMAYIPYIKKEADFL